MRTDILLTGVGGQGIVLTSKLIAAAAMEKNIPVMSAETIGMAQKGGSVFSFLRLGDDIYSPMFPERSADLMIAFEPAEAVRMLSYMKPGGKLILNTHAIMPVTAALSGSDYSGSEMTDYLRANVPQLITTDADKACAKLGSPKAMNMVMLGKAVRSSALPFDIEDMISVMKKTVKPQFVEMNVKALSYEEQ